MASREHPRRAVRHGHPAGATGGAPPWSTRSTRARSPTATATASATSPASPSRLDHLARLGIDVLWLSPGLPLADGRQRLRHQRLPGRRPALRHAGRPRRAHRRLPRARHPARHGPRRQPHLRRAPVVRRVARPELAQARLVLVAPGPAGSRARHRRAPSRTTGTSAFSGPGVAARRGAAASTTCTSSRRKQPDLNWENPRGPPGGLRDDALVGRPRRRRLPDGRHQPHLQGPRPARRPGAAGPAVRVVLRRGRRTAHGSTSSSPR